MGNTVMLEERSGLFDSSLLTCDECRDLLDMAAGAALAGNSLEQKLPGVARHIATCANCREEYESLVYVLRTASGMTAPHVDSIGVPTPLPVLTGPDSGSTWTIPAHTLTRRWFNRPALAQARSVTGQPPAFERHLLLAEVTETSWGLGGLEVVAQRHPGSPDQVEIEVNVAFSSTPREPVRVTLRYADQTLVSTLDERGCARFTHVALNSLVDLEARQVRSDLSLSLDSASDV